MSFYVVPTMSYQTQQKLQNKGKGGEKKKKKKKKRSNLETHDEISSNSSSSTRSSTSTSKLHVGDANSSGSLQTNQFYETPVVSISDENLAPAAKDKKSTSVTVDSTRQNSVMSAVSKISLTHHSQSVSGSISSAPAKLSGGRQRSTSEISTLSGTRFSRKLSTTFMNAIEQYSPNSTSRSSAVSSNSTSQSPLISNSPTSKHEALFKASYINNSDKISMSSAFLPTSEHTVPKDDEVEPAAGKIYIKPFKLITNLELLNSFQNIQKALINPQYQIIKFALFLSSVKGYHLGDAVNFGNVRNYSLSKFMSRLAKLDKVVEDASSQKSDAIYYIESSFTSHAFKMRYNIRQEMSKKFLKNAHQNEGEVIVHEELVQINFTNYVRYVLELPDMEKVSSEQLTDGLKEHYKNKKIFNEVKDKLFELSKEDLGVGNESSFSSVDNFFKMIHKISNDYFLLEKYFLHILFKINKNFQIEQRNLIRLFNLYVHNKKMAEAGEEFKPVRVLNYNSFYSSVNSWYMAVLNPFLDVYEASKYSEDPYLITNPVQYQEQLKSCQKSTTFDQPQNSYYEEYFRHVPDFKRDFATFSSYSPENLGKLQEKIFELSKSPQNQFNYKPRNFLYYGRSLSTIPDETFDFIQCRDNSFQFTPLNYKILLREMFRILKKGGSFELPGIQLGGNTLLSFQEGIKGHKDRLLKAWEVEGLKINPSLDAVPNFTDKILRELNDIFGDGNIKYSCALLNTELDVNLYLVKYILLRTFEIHGELELYTRNNEGEGNSHGSSVHFFITVVAEKK